MSKINFLQKTIIFAAFIFLSGFSFSSFAQTSSAPSDAPKITEIQKPQTKEQEPDQYVHVRLLADKTQVQGGETIRIGIEQTIHPGWHTYWINPGDSGTETTVNWEMPPGFSVTSLEWPTPNKIPYGPLTNYGYDGQVTLLQNLTLPEGIGSRAFSLQATVNVLVCHEICVPETHNVSIIFNKAMQPSPDKISTAEARLPENKPWSTSFVERDGQLIFKTIVKPTSFLVGAKNFTLFPEEWGAVDNNTNASLTILDDGFSISQKRGERTLSETPEIPLVLTFSKENGTHHARRIIARAEGINAAIIPHQATADEAVPTQLNAPSTQPTPTQFTPTKESSTISLWKALLFAIFGGMVLNLMPCVFPVLSIKALSLINLNGKEKEKARAYGLSYTAGILLSFAAIGGTLLVLKTGGAQIGWGFQLQSPAVIIFLTYLVFIIGLNLSGLFEFSGRLANIGANAGQKLAQKSGHKGAFFTGVLATLVATPCTAPFMGAAMGFALTQPAIISMLVFLSLGFGLALPYLALCYIPALRAKLPKPGHWMETFRQFLAFPMFITSAWLIWVLSQQITAIGIFCTLLAMIAIVFAFWLIRITPASGAGRVLSKLFIIISVLFILASPFLPSKNTHINENMEAGQQNGQNWEAFTPEKLSKFLQGDDPVFTNMTASWCITCKVNEKIALATTSTKTLFAEKNIHYLKGDWTNQNPAITSYLTSFDRSGVPLYVYYGARDPQSGKRPEPVLLPQLLTSGLIKKTIQ